MNQLKATSKDLSLAGTLRSESTQAIFKSILPSDKQADKTLSKWFNILIAETKADPKLMACTPDSLVGCLFSAAQLGLEPGKNIGHFYMIPRAKTCTMLVGYKGMLELARRSGEIESIEAHEVFEGDEFDYSWGITPVLRHKPKITKRDSKEKPILVYALAMLKTGRAQFDVMSIAEIEDIGKKSPSYNFGPWQTHPSEMRKKTVLKRLCKLLPMSIEAQTAIGLDDLEEVGKQDNSYVMATLEEK
ncbi:MAG: recombinase RecT [Desulfamplus sp.]